MRKKEFSTMKKFLVAACAVALFPTASGNQASAQNVDWDNLNTQVSGGGTVNLNQNYTAETGNTAIVVPDRATTINGNNHSLSGYRNPDNSGATAPQLIQNNSTAGLTVNNMTFTQGGGDNGGAIGNYGTDGNKGVLIINNSTFDKNTTSQPATGGGGAVTNVGKGGAIYNETGDVTVNGSTFSNNGIYTNADGSIIYQDEDGNIGTKPDGTTITPENGGKPFTTLTGGAIHNSAGTAGDPNSLTVQNNSKFEGNYAAMGGAIYNEGTAVIKDSEFKNNHAVIPVTGTTDGNHGIGGAIMNENGNLTVSNTVFDGNTAEINSGAIYNSGSDTETNITNSTFTNNSAFASDGTNGSGGAIGNYSGGTINITGNSTIFDGNSAGFGGAIYNSSLASDASGTYQTATVNMNGAQMTNNYAVTYGGAFYNYGVADVKNTTFDNNGVSSDNTKMTAGGGAIYNSAKISGTEPNGNMKLTNTTFANNVASTGGAVANTGDLTVSYSTFKDNGYVQKGGNSFVTATGGAIANRDSVATNGVTNMNISNTRFEGNVAQNSGGAVYNDGSNAVISNSAFINNGQSADGTITTGSGGAVYNQKDLTIVDSSFRGNVATSGGALFGATGSVTNIKAENSNVIFGDAANPSSTVDTVFLDSGAKANLMAKAGNTIQFNSNVSGQVDNKGVINVNQNAAYQGTVDFNAPVENSDISLYNGTLKFSKDENLGLSNNLNLMGGTLNMLNGAVNPIGAGSINIAGNTNLLLDVDIANQTMDSILAENTNVTYSGGSLNVAGMKSISDSKAKDVAILFTDSDAIAGKGVVTSNGVKTIDGPIYKYAVKQMYDNGGTGNRPGEYFVFNSIGNSDSVLIAPVAAQLGGFLVQDNLYRQSFANMDMVMLMTREQRQAMKFRNKYASTDDVTAGLYQPTIIGEERDGFWVRPFSNFESVPLSGGPKVSNVSYGALIGGDSDIIDLGHGWDATFSFFGAYHGSHQAYNGIDIWQNGGSLGAVGVVYKGNFFSGLTANVGASGVEANSEFGNEHFPMLMTGAAWKSGYNFEFMQGKFILQPSYMMSYTFVNAFDYTNAAGVQITQDPLNVIEIIPGIKLIANTKNGWQPYLGVNMTWNIMDKTRFYANDVALDRLSVDPFVEYGVGLQKRIGDRFTGYGQCMIRNGGRNGVALTMGWRWALGD